MAFEADLAASAANLLKFQAIQSGNIAAKFQSGIPYFAFARAAQMIQDLALKSKQEENIGLIQANIPDLLNDSFGLSTNIMTKEGTDAVIEVRAELERLYKGLYDNWKAGIWHGVGSAYSGAMEQFLGAGDILWAYKHLANRVGVTPKMARHWSRVFRPTVPNTALGFDLMTKEFIDEADWKTLASYEGWSDKYIGILQKAFHNYPDARTCFRLMARGYMTEATYKKYLKYAGWMEFPTGGWDEAFKTLYAWWPSAYEAFFMWKKGIIDITERNKYYKGQGYQQVLFDKITANFEYIPTLYDIIRIADYQEVDLIWATKIMQERGMRSRDIAKFVEYLKYRPLREETRNLTDQLVWRYQYGRITPVNFQTELAKLPIGTTEKSLITDYAEMRYEDELITEQMEIYMWQFRMGWISETNYLNGLLALGIREEKANLIVETEKAQGYFGYY